MFIQDSLKYIIVAFITVINFLGLYAVNDIHEQEKEPPSTLEVQETTTTVQIINVDKEQITFDSIHEESKNPYKGIVFKHGDISWLPILAEQAGWPKNTWDKLGQIILRESGGCPNRLGGDVVDENCNLIRVSEWNHRSDTGLLQINGVNYNTKRNKWAAVCLQMQICTQEPLLDPLTNLKAGKLLYDLSGWAPWDPCTWGPEWSHRCQKAVND